MKKRTDLDLEKQSHDSEIRRIASEFNLMWPCTIEDIMKAIRAQNAMMSEGAKTFIQFDQKNAAYNQGWRDGREDLAQHQFETNKRYKEANGKVNLDDAGGDFFIGLVLFHSRPDMAYDSIKQGLEKLQIRKGKENARKRIR